ncbi:aminoglycoside phosphotransferase family protein [Luteolibacter algae]|uniref:Aminoglycoside phosphotransferase family protein n=1 Tax=Luteolibacter algae TaxID=454151 RepID=A0ABW5D5Q5_9BACT
MTNHPDISLPIRAASETALAHGLSPDRCEILQNGNTLVLRLSDTLVARVVTDLDGPRQGSEWFERENAIAQYLAKAGAPVIPMHDKIPPGPHQHLGYTLNFWQFVSAIDEEPPPSLIGRTLFQCHDLLRHFPDKLPELAILTESLELLETLEQKSLFPGSTLELLRKRLRSSLAELKSFPHQALHGDAHGGNLLNTTIGLLWTDWEDTFCGPVEWDIASIIWNARILEDDQVKADGIITAYCAAGGMIHEEALHQSLIARAAVMSAWYPVLYPNPSKDRKEKLQSRLDWLADIR